MDFYCSHCNQKHNFQQKQIEKKVQCKKCRKLFVLEEKTSIEPLTNQASPSMVFAEGKKQLEQLFVEKEEKIEGKIFGRYKIIKKLGHGGMGRVYQVHDPKLDRLVGLKILLSEETKERFLREAKAIASLNHPNIVRIHDIGIEQNQSFFTMDFIAGQSLEEYLQNAALNIRKFSQVMLKIAKAIEYSHDRGVIHRDLKPSNIMLDKKQEPYITDFLSFRRRWEIWQKNKKTTYWPMLYLHNVKS